MIRGCPVYQRLEHGANPAILVRADGERSLFERAAAAMFDLMVDVNRIADDLDRGAVVDELEIEAPDREALMVDFLDELLSLALLGHVMFGAFEVTEIRETRLHARAWGRPHDPERNAFRTELKGVTHDHLLVGPTPEGWFAQVVFEA